MYPVIIHQAGPLPIKTTVKWPSSDIVTMAVSGSAWTQSPNTTVAVNVSVDGQMIGTLQMYANQSGVHLAFPTAFLPSQGTFGEFTVALTPANGTTLTDANDMFTVALIY
jgi:hypothetical protein